MYYINKFYSTENLIQSIKDYIEFYNNKRFQAKLKCLAPMEYQTKHYLSNLTDISSLD